MADLTGETVRVTVAYDGSGVAMRQRAKVLADYGDTLDVEYEVAEFSGALSGTEQVVRSSISALGSAAEVASFGWLD